jgi:hypothetical protein
MQSNEGELSAERNGKKGEVGEESGNFPREIFNYSQFISSIKQWTKRERSFDELRNLLEPCGGFRKTSFYSPADNSEET